LGELCVNPVPRTEDVTAVETTHPAPRPSFSRTKRACDAGFRPTQTRSPRACGPHRRGQRITAQYCTFFRHNVCQRVAGPTTPRRRGVFCSTFGISLCQRYRPSRRGRLRSCAFWTYKKRSLLIRQESDLRAHPRIRNSTPTFGSIESLSAMFPQDIFDHCCPGLLWSVTDRRVLEFKFRCPI